MSCHANSFLVARNTLQTQQGTSVTSRSDAIRKRETRLWLWTTCLCSLRDPGIFLTTTLLPGKHSRADVPDRTMFWAYHVNNPEGTHALVHLCGQRRILASSRYIAEHSMHTYTKTKIDSSVVNVEWYSEPEVNIETLQPPPGWWVDSRTVT